MTLAIHSPDELIAALPHLLGFKPEESLIFVPLRPDLPLARVDIPTTAREREGVWNSIGSALSRHAQLGARTAIVCITPDRAHAEQVGQEFASRLAAIGIDAPLRLWADDTSWCDFTTGQSGLQTGAARDQVAAATVLDGRPRPAPSRAAIASSLVGDRQPIEALLPKARANAAMGSARREGEWAQGRVEEFHRDGVRLSDADAARLLIGVDFIPTRDSLWNTITRDTTTSHIALWRDLTLTREAAPTSPPPNRSSEPAWRAATDRAGGLIAAYADAPPAANDLQRATEVGTEPEAVEEPGPDEVIPDHVEPLDPGLDEDVAAWFDPDCRLPRVHLLGPVRASAHGNPSAVARRKPHYVELLAFLALHPEGVSTRQVAEAFSLSKERVRIDIGVVRKWLGKSQRTGQPHLPPAAQSRAAGESGVWTYQVDDVLVDADLFRRLRARGQARGDDGQTDFHAALRLVDGAPFSDLREAGWSWLLDADSRDDEILACAIVDVAHEVVAAALPDGDLGRAERAVEIARMASPYDEVARVDRAAVLVAQGHEDAAREFLSSAVYNRVDDHLGPLDVPERTAELLAKRTTDRRSNGHH